MRAAIQRCWDKLRGMTHLDADLVEMLRDQTQIAETMRQQVDILSNRAHRADARAATLEHVVKELRHRALQLEAQAHFPH